jgi:small subunit ribosomal protein S17
MPKTGKKKQEKAVEKKRPRKATAERKEKKKAKQQKPGPRPEHKAEPGPLEGRKTIGLDVAPPEKACGDTNCPWHGSLPIRGRVFRGLVRSAKAHNTVVVEWGYHRFSPKYERYERRKSSVVAHNPPCMHAREDNEVIVAECRPISKTKSFVVVGIVGKPG